MSSRCRLRVPKRFWHVQKPYAVYQCVGQTVDLKQFPDGTFRLIIFDPPFWLKHGSSEQNNMGKNFGYLVPETWQVDLKQGISECWRVLKVYGILFGKWSNYQISSHEFLKLFPVDPLIYQVTAARQFISKGLKRSYVAHIEEKVKTVWFCFMKIPKQEGLS